jgi:spore germination protein
MTKKKMRALRSILAATALFFPILHSDAGVENPFDDIFDSYAKEQIIDLYSHGIVSGMGNNQFEPKKIVTRAEFITMLDQTAHLQPLNHSTPAFSDVPSYLWSFGWIQSGVSLDLIKGKSKTTFEPESPITRQEAATLLIRALEPNSVGEESNTGFQDDQEIAPWAKNYVLTAKTKGYMSGYAGYFRPNDSMTREEAAVVLDRIAQLYQTNGSVRSDSKVAIAWQYDESKDQFEQHVQSSAWINTISPGWFYLDGSNALIDQADVNLSSWAHRNGLKVWPLVGNHFNTMATTQLLTSSENRSIVIQQLVNYAKKYNIDGFNLDFEGIDPKNRGDYSLFVKELSTALHAQQRTLSIDVPPDLGSEWSEPFDYVSLAGSADYLVFMGYDEHWNGDPTAGSVSSLPWFTDGLDKLIQEVGAGKIIAGLPLYTRDWYVNNQHMTADELTLAEQNRRLQTEPSQTIWNSILGQYIARYVKGGVTHTIWVEDPRSLSLKYQHLLNKDLAGSAYWSVGEENTDIWKALKNSSLLKAIQLGKSSL